MARTRAQLEADAIERLKSLQGGTFSYKDVAKAVGVNGYVSADTFRDKMLELLVDDARLRLSLSIEFQDGKIQGVCVNGERFERVKECELEHHDTGWANAMDCWWVEARVNHDERVEIVDFVKESEIELYNPALIY